MRTNLVGIVLLLACLSGCKTGNVQTHNSELEASPQSLNFYDCRGKVPGTFSDSSLSATLSIGPSLLSISTWGDIYDEDLRPTQSKPLNRQGEPDATLTRYPGFKGYQNTADEDVEYYVQNQMLTGRGGQFVIFNKTNSKAIKLTCTVKRK